MAVPPAKAGLSVVLFTCVVVDFTKSFSLDVSSLILFCCAEDLTAVETSRFGADTATVVVSMRQRRHNV